MFDVIGQMRLTLRIGSGNQQREIPLNPSLLDDFTLIQNNLLKVPTIQMSIYDNLGLQDSLGNFVDGTPFSIDVGWDLSDEPYRSHPFRLYTLPQQVSTEQGSQLRILGYLDIAQYFRKRYEQTASNSLGKSLNSFEVLEHIAQSNKLVSELDQTKDEQIWLPDGRVQADYARFVTNHGWVNEESCMELAITQIPDTVSQYNTNDIPWMMRYLNIVDKMVGRPDFVLTNAQLEEDSLPSYRIADIDVKNHSGFFNHWVGYGNRIGQEMLAGDYPEHEQTHIRRSAQHLELNRDLKEDLGIVRREVAPIDCGNTHPNFIKARHQNRRIKSQFSTTVDVLTVERTSIRIFDKIKLTLTIQHSNQVNKTYQGDYLVTAKTIAIRGGAYREKFELAGQGINNNIDNLLT